MPSTEEMQVLDACLHETTIREIAAWTGIPADQVKRLLYGLEHKRLVKRKKFETSEGEVINLWTRVGPED